MEDSRIRKEKGENMTVAEEVLNDYNYLTNGPPIMGPKFYKENYQEAKKRYYEKFHNFTNEIHKKYNVIEFDYADDCGINVFLIFDDNSSIKINYGNCAGIQNGYSIPNFDELKEYKDQGIKNITIYQPA